MPILRLIRYGLWGLVAAVAFLVVGASAGWFSAERGNQVASIGGPFTLVDHKGERVTQETLRGKPSLLFFGFTHCPDICPTTLFEATGWLEALGDKAGRLNVAFVSVDPERDTPAVLAEYMQAFDPRIRALTGSPAEVAGIVKAYRVHAAKVPLDAGGYTMDHTATVFLVDAKGNLFGTISPGEGRDQALAKLRRLVA